VPGLRPDRPLLGKIDAEKNKARQSPGFVSNLALQAGQ
jgi:hypothetical protein